MIPSVSKVGAASALLLNFSLTGRSKYSKLFHQSNQALPQQTSLTVTEFSSFRSDLITISSVS